MPDLSRIVYLKYCLEFKPMYWLQIWFWKLFYWVGKIKARMISLAMKIIALKPVKDNYLSRIYRSSIQLFQNTPDVISQKDGWMKCACRICRTYISCNSVCSCYRMRLEFRFIYFFHLIGKRKSGTVINA